MALDLSAEISRTGAHRIIGSVCRHTEEPMAGLARLVEDDDVPARPSKGRKPREQG
jgi:hypothetical protein